MSDWEDEGENEWGEALASVAGVDTTKSMLDQDDIDRLMNPDDQDREIDVMERIANSTIVNYERLPMLDVVFERLVRLLTENLRQYMSANVEVGVRDVSSVRFGDFMTGIPLPSLVTVIRAVEWDANILAVADSKIIYTIVDILLGGRQSPITPVEGRPFTSIETRLTERILGIISRYIGEAFNPLTEIRFEVERMETNPALAAIVRETTACLRATLYIDVEGRDGQIELLIPYSTLEPVRNLLVQPYMGERFGRDSIWEHHFESKLKESSIDMQAVLHETTASLGETLNWKVGTMLHLDCTPDTSVRLVAGDTELFEGTAGQKNGNIAVKIESSPFEKGQREKDGAESFDETLSEDLDNLGGYDPLAS
jgi:flagellar motor switch protein FliM